jgi:tagaturonate reductase
MINLFRENLRQLRGQTGLTVPGDAIFQLPEKVLQFGTGAFLRGLADYYVDQANRQGIFNGRIVVVKSTDNGDLKIFDRQDNLYTICVRGSRNGQCVEENIISAAISRVLNAKTQWSLVLDLAKNPAISLVVSNTTETGIRLVQDDIYQWPPVSFPGKLLAFLYARYVAFAGNAAYGLTIIPTELIPDNGQKLEAIVLELAHRNGLDSSFIDWIEQHNCFCNSLVDRIVPGKPEPDVHHTLSEQLGYRDELLITAEPYHLWAIEGDEKVRGRIPFAGIDEGLIVSPDIERYRELKLRLLNGAHTLCCGLAHLAGFRTVVEAMENPHFATFATRLMETEIALAIPYPVDESLAVQFARQVLERFKNPYIQHRWLDIAEHYSAKMLARVIPIFHHFEQKHLHMPEHIVFGFAAYICFMRPVRKEGDNFYGFSDEAHYPIEDNKAFFFYQKWTTPSLPEMLKTILKDADIWGEDFSKRESLLSSLLSHIKTIRHDGMQEALRAFVGHTACAEAHS